MSDQEPMSVYWLRDGDPTITVVDRFNGRPVIYPACQHDGCPLPVATMTGSSMRLYGLGTGWTTYECADGHRYAYKPQDGKISHYGAPR